MKLSSTNEVTQHLSEGIASLANLMSTSGRILGALLVSAAIPGLAFAADPVEGSHLEIITSPASVPRTVSLDTIPEVTVERQDIQYARSLKFQGISLERVLQESRGPSSGDTAILHFANGMVVPIPLHDEEAFKRMDVFIARRVWTRQGNNEMDWDSLPNIEKKDTGQIDVRPIVFHGNKVVVSTRWHPAVPKEKVSVFSPWLYVDTLVGIEFVNEMEYQRGFPTGRSPAAHRGHELFTQRCQFCHGVRGKGATFGWDFVEPVALSTYRNPDSLYLHVKYREGNAASRGLMMPSFSDITAKDSKALWQWMRDAATDADPLSP